MQNDTYIKLIALAYDNDWLGILHFDACMGQFPFILDGLPSNRWAVRVNLSKHVQISSRDK